MKNKSNAKPTIRQILFPALRDLVNLPEELRILRAIEPKEFCISSMIEPSLRASFPISWLTFLKVANLFASSSSLSLFYVINKR